MTKKEIINKIKEHNKKEYTNQKSIEGLELTKLANELGLDAKVNMQNGIITLNYEWTLYNQFCKVYGLNKNDFKTLKIYNQCLNTQVRI